MSTVIKHSAVSFKNCISVVSKRAITKDGKLCFNDPTLGISFNDTYKESI